MDAREEILGRLRRVPAPTPEPRPQLPPLPELALNREGLLERLMDELTKLEAVPHRVASMGEAKEKLGEILTGEGITKVITSTDEVVSAFDLIAWGKEREISVYLPSHFPDREAFKRAVFEEVEAGITGADFAVAESGTLGIIHDRHQPRLISLAPSFTSPYSLLRGWCPCTNRPLAPCLRGEKRSLPNLPSSPAPA